MTHLETWAIIKPTASRSSRSSAVCACMCYFRAFVVVLTTDE